MSKKKLDFEWNRLNKEIDAMHLFGDLIHSGIVSLNSINWTYIFSSKRSINVKDLYYLEDANKSIKVFMRGKRNK